MYHSFRKFSTCIVSQSPKGLILEKNDGIRDEIRELAMRGHLSKALSHFYDFHASPPKPPLSQLQQVYATLFHACARHGCLQQGRSLHNYMLSHQPNNSRDLFVANHLINMYSKCGDLSYAHLLFDEMGHRNVVSWTTLISGYAQYGKAYECFHLFSSMLVHCRPNEFALASVLACCDYEHGKQVHAYALKMALDTSIYVGNALITMYSKNRNLAINDSCRDEAWSVFQALEFRNIVSWNSMIAGFQQRNLGAQAVNLFIIMQNEGIRFDRATLLSVFSSFNGTYCDTNDLGLWPLFQLHSLTLKSGFSSNLHVATALIKAYSDVSGETSHCYKLFLEMNSDQDIVSWTSIITVFADREPEGALFLFRKLYHVRLKPDRYTFSIILKACSSLLDDRHALAIHGQVVKAGFEEDMVIENALIHAYARCGSISLAKQVFSEMHNLDAVSWNSMLKAYALHGQAKEALDLFSYMNLRPDSATMVALLSACSHVGFVEEGIKLFESMFAYYGIFPQIDHYACMVDILGRAGRVIEAMILITKMPMEPDSVVWSALLGSCRKHGEMHLAKLAAEKLKELEPRSSLSYVQMSNIYCSIGNYNEAGLVRKEMKGSRVRKDPALSLIEIGTAVHEFASGGNNHPQREAISIKLVALIEQLKKIGYVPDTSFALHDIEEEHKEEQLFHHSEKLALIFAMMNEDKLQNRGRTIKIVKNIRICVDCHNFMKLASAHLQKEIIVRDSNRFHHFKNRICSCNDYW
ncbi:hypothetical protein K2173_022251 [Erythroxylum novogranatense]|uniref:DYW domain-containing protein n=1 Tax=Erythroxylum novogranatense TaxID=1862640 RepID=A0AAV8SUH1_9ROSI|nr:hypothetical protein K2173_022251 [Erythroxylum novogranatense]